MASKQTLNIVRGKTVSLEITPMTFAILTPWGLTWFRNRPRRRSLSPWVK